MTVVPLFCARFIRQPGHSSEKGFNAWFQRRFERMLNGYNKLVLGVIGRPVLTLGLCAMVFFASLAAFPLLGVSFFPRTDAGQFVINVKAPSGTKLLSTEAKIARLEALIHRVVAPEDLDIIVSNVGVDPGFSAIFTTNSAMHTAFVQVGLKEGHKVSSDEYMLRVKRAMADELPELASFFSTGSLIDAVLNTGRIAPIDVQVAGSDLNASYKVALNIASEVRRMPGVADVFIPQDIDAPALKLDIDRLRAGELGLTQREVVTNVITALTSNQMVAPNVWIDPRNGNNYFLSVQYPEHQVESMMDLRSIPLHGKGVMQSTRLDMVSKISRIEAPTEVDHYQIRREIDVYIRPLSEDLGKIATQVEAVTARMTLPKGVEVSMRGVVESMRASFKSFALGLSLSLLLLYLILVAQFRSFTDPFLILLAFPPGLTGGILTLWLSDTTLNVMSLMGAVMLAGITMSNSILIVEFAHQLMDEGMKVRDAIVTSCRVRLRPIMMTTLATIIGLLPMALKMGEGSESYAPLARALVGGLTVSGVATVFIVPAGFVLAYRNHSKAR